MNNTALNPNGDLQILGTAGSWIFSCPVCGHDHFRIDWHAENTWGYCYYCSGKQKMEPVLVKDLDTRWKPLWNKTSG